ncbi:MAG TPA: Ig-like domain-containing protein [Pseudolysinimonas sp.]|nr:Ig-like domain-containing protein [Pseudolysinimonas sp.]
MVRSWIRAHRSLLATAVSGGLIVALVVTIAVISSGYTAQRMTLNDASVWVANGSEKFVGRANTEALELNTVVRGGATDLAVVQRDETVLVVDRANATLQTIDPATSKVLDEVALPPDRTQVYLAGDRVIIFEAGTGELWIVPLVELSGFDSTATASLSLGRGAVISVNSDGVMFTYSPERKQVTRVDAAHSESADQTWDLTIPDPADVQITSLGLHWAILDPTTSVLFHDGRSVDLGAVVPDGDAPVLQLPGPDSDRLLIGTRSSLISVPLSGAAPVPLVDGQSGRAAAPLVLGGCEYGAWTSGSAWRRCLADGTAGREVPLASMPGSGQISFAVNRDRAVLTDARSGASWAIQQNGQLIDNWDDLIVQEEDQQEEQNNQDLPPDIDKDQKPPVAVNDEFGARPGRATLLPVLLNDYDPNADVLVITDVSGIDETVGRLDLVTRNQQLQLTLTDKASSQLSFSYSISDGRGGTASATVTVAVRGPGENSPPMQIRTTKTTVQEGGRVSTQVIGDWVDPDGDAFYLINAATAAPDTVSYKPDGVVVFSDHGEGGSSKTVTLTMTDGKAQASGSLVLSVKPAGEVPIVIEPWVALVTSGQEITVRPMVHVRGGTGTLRLNAVPARPGSTIVPSFDAGTFTFESTDVRTHYVEFTVTDGDQTATGVVRIDVTAPPDSNTRPITVPKTVFVRTQSTQTVDPTATDIDPSGGVLVVTGVSNVPLGGAIQAEVIDQRLVRVTLTGPLDGEAVTFNYSISNGLAEATGTITVVELPRPAQLQPPLASDDEATVRVGDVIDVPVLDNDEQPDGEEIVLLPKLAQQLPDDGGLLFVAGDRLRYLAPSVAGNYTAVYSIAGPDGQTAQARVTFSVREVDAATNSSPAPARVTARVLAGEKIQVDIPLTGIDPDGDSVQLIGIASNPEKGSVLSVGPDFIEYEAGDYSKGTDEFRYSVTDALGARAEGTVRIGISAPLDGARNPVANADEVTVRPNRTVSVQVLANDSDPDGSPLHVASVRPNTPGTTANIVDDSVIDITPPAAPGTYSVIYTVANDVGGSSSNFVNVTVDPDAPLAYPIVSDTVLGVNDVLDHDSVDVAVLDNVFFADGNVANLGVALVQGYSSGATILANKRIRVTIGDKSQIIPFSVSHPDDDSIRSYAFIWVPGYDDALPQLDRTAPPLTVKSEETLRIDLNDYVVALGGNQVRLADTSTVRATHANGEDLVVDSDTLSFTSADQYFGPASITFEVTDGTLADDPAGKRAILTLPITVEPRTNQPPAFTGGVVPFEPGQQVELDLVRLTNYPYDDVSELVYSVLSPLPEGFSYELNGQRLVLTAKESTPSGTNTSISIGVRDDVNDGRAGRITLQVVPSTRPIIRPVADRAIAERGQTTVIDVLANDEANNPFPGRPLSVTDTRGLGELPEGVTVTPSADRSKLTVTVSSNAAPVDANVQYEVADATLDESRRAWGNVTISVQDVPDPVSSVHVSEFGDRLLKLSWAAGQFNNSPITGYEVTMSGTDGGVISTTSCETTVNCELRTPGNGPDNAVRLSMVAINAIGKSSPTSLPGAIWSDIIPPPPTNLSDRPLDNGLRITWAKPGGGAGSPIELYVITVGGVTQSMNVDANDPVGTVYSRNVQAPSIANGSSVGYSVSARNGAPSSLATWNQASGTGVPAGPPLQLASPSASGSLSDGTTAQVSWAGAFGANGATIGTYYVSLYTGSQPSCSVSGVDTGNPVVSPPGGNTQTLSGGTTGASFSGLTPNQPYSITVFAYNGQGCTASPEVQVTPRAAPGTVSAIDHPAGPVASSPSTWDFRLDGFTIGSGSTDADQFRYRLIGGTTDQSESGVVDPGSLLTTDNGSQYGNVIGVQLRACKSYPEGTLCSASWSPTFPLGVPVNNSVPGGLAAVVTDDGGGLLSASGYWTWGSMPSGPGYSSVGFSCGGDDDSSTPQQCEVSGGLLGASFPNLTVTITANGTTYSRAYAWSQYS